MKKGTLLLLFFFLLCSFSRAQYVTLEGRQFKDENGNDFYPVVCNFMTQYMFSDSRPEPFFPSPLLDHDNYCFDCNSLSSCLDQIQRNFDTISAMNFNAIRLYMLNPVYYNYPDSDTSANWVQGWGIKPLDLDTLLEMGCWIPEGTPETAYTTAVYLSQSFGPDPVLDRILQYYDSVLLRASRSSIKVLLNVGAAVGDFSPDFIDGYSTYLSLVADHFGSGTPVSGSKEDSIRKAIMAYVILEEAGLSWNDTTLWPSITAGHSKQDVCEFISSLYNTLKQHDPHHLVTLGGVPIDLFEFDPGVMKLDFYSPHIYPQKRSYMGADFFQGMVDEAHSWFYWLANNVPMPYLIGETGFKSKYMVDTDPGNHGTNLQQKQYADSTLKHTRACKASGYSWWYYQDYKWNPHDSYFGLLGREGNEWYGQTVRKPVVEAFKSFNPATPPGTMTKPASYYDPYHHAEYAPASSATNKITGHIVDANTIPVKDAWVCGRTYLGPDPLKPKDTLYDFHYTFSDENGNFTLIPNDYLERVDQNTIEDLLITAPSGSRIHHGWTSPFVPVVSGETYTLTSSNWEYDGSISNRLVTGPNNTLQAFNALEVHDVHFLEESASDVKARTSVSLHTVTHAHFGSTTHIYCTETFPECQWIPDCLEKEVPVPEKRTATVAAEQIAVTFLPFADSVGINLYPNPCQNSITLDIWNAPGFPPPYCVEIFSSLGVRIQTHTLEQTKSTLKLESISPGICFMRISNPAKSYDKMFIKTNP